MTLIVWMRGVIVALGLVLLPGSPSAAGRVEPSASSLVSRTSCLGLIDPLVLAEDRPIQVHRHDGVTVSGLVRSVSPDEIVLARSEGDVPVTVRDSEVMGVTYWTRGPRPFVTTGEIVGTVAGFVVGFVIGSIVYDSDPDDFFQEEEGDVRVLFGLTGALVGALVGHFAGSDVSFRKVEVQCAR